ncbi:MAG: CoA transferase [Acidobacteriia bacterium]|nr:CoA transferase [Terriglobia bacterium]
MLNDLTVLDLSRHLPGPYATMVLGDWGAQVIKIEEPALGDPVRLSPPFVDGTSALFLQLNRNKKGLTLNLKSSGAKEVFLKLSREADVLVESFRPSVTARLGIDYDSLKQHNPRLIYCSISGYGQNGPYRNRAGHDINYIARAGLLGLNTDASGTPVIPPIQIADLASGAMLCLAGILIALLARQKSGEGKHVDVSMLDGLLALLPVAFSQTMAGDSLKVGEKMELTGSVPFYNVYRTADERFLALGAIEPKFWENFCGAIGRRELTSKQFATGDEREQVFQVVAGTLASRTQGEWVAAFEGLDVCCEPVDSLDEVVTNPQIQQRGMLQEVALPSGGVSKQLGSPLKFSGLEAPVYQSAPKLGEHTDEILTRLGYSRPEISFLRSQGAI